MTRRAQPPRRAWRDRLCGNYFTIYLNKAVTTSVGPISWMVTERP